MTSLEKLSYCYFGLFESFRLNCFKEENSDGSLTQVMTSDGGFELQPDGLLLGPGVTTWPKSSCFHHVFLTCLTPTKWV